MSIVTQLPLLPRVLVVEDEPRAAELLCRQLHWCQTTRAANGEEAWEHLKQHTYHVVLLDLMMPVLDGHGVLRRMKQHGMLDSTHVIVLSAKKEVADHLDAYEDGVVDYLVKPFPLEVAACKVRHNLARLPDVVQHHSVGHYAIGALPGEHATLLATYSQARAGTMPAEVVDLAQLIRDLAVPRVEIDVTNSSLLERGNQHLCRVAVRALVSDCAVVSSKPVRISCMDVQDYVQVEIVHYGVVVQRSLALLLAQEVTYRHGGDFATTESTEGTTFRMRFPLHKERA